MVEVFGAIALAAWIYLALFHGMFWRVRKEDPPSPHTLARVAVVIPARDEAETISATVSSLAAQSHPIWVVDDDSSDETAALAARAGGTRTTVAAAGSRQPGWTGKLWALSRGVELARSAEPDYFLFTDADIVHALDSIASLVARAESGGLDLVSYMVRLHCSTPPERLTIPAFVFFFFMLYPPEWIRDPRRAAAGAAGGCILIRRAALEQIGGLERIRGELIDDCALARAVKRSGGRVWLGLAHDTVSSREYRGFGEIWNMIARTAFTQLRYSALLLAGTVAGMGLLYVVPVAGALMGSIPAAIAWFLMAALFWPVLRFYRQPWWLAPLLPVTACFYAAATLHSAIRYWRGEGGQWKGRNQAVAAGQR